MRVVLEHGLLALGFILAVTLVVRVSRGHQHAGGAISWLLAIVFIPYVGVPLYLILSQRKLARRTGGKNSLYQGPASPEPPGTSRDMERILAAAGLPPRRTDNQASLHFNGETAYHQLMHMLAGAGHTIHVATFILGRDEVGREIVSLLARKAREGVRVRLLLDSLGCFYTRRRSLRPLREAGGRVGWFLPMLPLRRKWSANLRNHRKIVVVDGHTAMAGGMNLDGRFMGPKHHPARFLDSAVFIEGPAVADIDNVFISDWTFTTGEQVPESESAYPDISAGESVMQVVPSGPDVPEDTLYDALLAAAMDARDRIWIVTPYFLPDDPMIKVLALQARIGRDVRIVLPHKSNHRVADLARGVAVRELRQAGAKIYGYRRGMVHTKLLLFDHAIGITGSPNLDMRSLYLNYEIALFHYSELEISQIADWIAWLVSECEPLEMKPPSYLREWTEGVAALASPLL